jgi:hypothetical protein
MDLQRTRYKNLNEFEEGLELGWVEFVGVRFTSNHWDKIDPDFSFWCSDPDRIAELTPTAWAARISRLVEFARQRLPNALTNIQSGSHFFGPQ